MADERLRDLDRRAEAGDADAYRQAGRARCRVGDHDLAVWMSARWRPREEDLPELVVGCPRCGLEASGGRPSNVREWCPSGDVDLMLLVVAACREHEDGLAECSLCHRLVLRSDTCSTLACRGCHRSISFEACLAGSDALQAGVASSVAMQAAVAEAAAREAALFAVDVACQRRFGHTLPDDAEVVTWWDDRTRSAMVRARWRRDGAPFGVEVACVREVSEALRTAAASVSALRRG